LQQFLEFFFCETYVESVDYTDKGLVAAKVSVTKGKRKNEVSVN